MGRRALNLSNDDGPTCCDRCRIQSEEMIDECTHLEASGRLGALGAFLRPGKNLFSKAIAKT